VIIAWNERRFEWRPLAYTTGGLLLGNVINPYFPHNLMLFLEHFLEKFKVGSDFVVSVGGEWYPYNGMELLTNFPVALGAMLIGYILFMPKNGKLPEKATFFLMFVTILLAAQFRSKRFAEYFPPFAVLFVAFAWQAFTVNSKDELPDDVRRELEPFLDVTKPSAADAWWVALKQALVWTLGIVLFAAFLFNMVGFHYFGIDQNGLVSDIRGNEDNTRYQRAMEWAVANIPAGERIFNCNWDDFPKLFFYDQKHSYAYGLDPNYLYSQNPDLYKDLMDITGGKVDDPAPIIRDKFGAKYIFADAKENDDMIIKALDSGWVEKIYEDDEARILKIRDQKGEAATESVDEGGPETPEEKKILDEEERKDAVNNPAANIDNDDDN
jgi:hypothetical protein